MYKAFVNIKNGNAWIPKKEASTFFPPSWTEAKIIQEINNAYNNKTKDAQNNTLDNHWTGHSSEGIPIQLFLRPNTNIGSIITAFPKY
jgi:hypothetical protein